MIEEELIKMIEKDFRKNDEFKKREEEGEREKNEILKTILSNVARFDSKTKIMKMIKII